MGNIICNNEKRRNIVGVFVLRRFEAMYEAPIEKEVRKSHEHFKQNHVQNSRFDPGEREKRT